MPVRKIKAGYSNTTSSFHSIKLNREVNAESSLEVDFLFQLDHESNVVDFEEQPLTIQYTSPTGKLASYTPDALVYYKIPQITDNDSCEQLFTEKTVLYEVKFREDLRKNWKKLKPKFKAAIQLCRQKGWRFKIMTEVEIRSTQLENLEFLYHFSRTLSPLENEIRQVIYDYLKTVEVSTPKEVLAMLFSQRNRQAEAMPVLWRMIYDKTITVDMHALVNMHSPILIDQEVK